MKKMVLLLGLAILSSCATNDDAAVDQSGKNSVELSSSTSRLSTTMSVSCISTLPNYTAKISWKLGNYIPFPEAEAYIEVIPKSGSTSFPMIAIPVPYPGGGGYLNVAHAGSTTTGNAWMSGGTLYMMAKEFEYRYVIYDIESTEHDETIWKFHQLVP